MLLRIPLKPILLMLGVASAAQCIGQQPSSNSKPPMLVSASTIPKPSITAPTPHPTPPVATPSGTAFDKFKNRRRPGNLSFADVNDHEDAGVLNDGGSIYTGVFAVHTIYSPSNFSLQLPAGAAAPQTLFAPTTRGTNGACIEVGTAYTASPGSTSTNVEVYAFDFCMTGGPNWGKRVAVTQDFIDTYAGATAHGQRAYALAVYTNDTTITGSSPWRAELYNFKTQQWEEFYTSRGSFAAYDPRGWSIFETWYQPGQCSKSLPVLGVEGLAYYQPVSKQWENLAETMSPQGTVPLRNHTDLGGSCFLPDSHGPASYHLSPDVPAYNMWKVDSSGQ